MFGTQLQMGIHKVGVKTTSLDGRLLRTCRIQFTREFDDEIAMSLGVEARNALAGLRSAGLNKAELPLTAVVVQADLSSLDRSDALMIEAMGGIKAVGTRAKSDQEPPTIMFEFECMWSKRAWEFLGERCAETVSVLLTPKQTQLFDAAAH